MTSTPARVFRLIDVPEVTLSVEHFADRLIRYRIDYIGGDAIIGPVFTFCEGSGVEALLRRVVALDSLLRESTEEDVFHFDATFQTVYAADTTRFLELHLSYPVLRPDFVSAHAFIRVEGARKTEFAMVGVSVVLGKGFAKPVSEALAYLEELEGVG